MSGTISKFRTSRYPGCPGNLVVRRVPRYIVHEKEIPPVSDALLGTSHIWQSQISKISVESRRREMYSLVVPEIVPGHPRRFPRQLWFPYLQDSNDIVGRASPRGSVLEIQNIQEAQENWLAKLVRSRSPQISRMRRNSRWRT